MSNKDNDKKALKNVERYQLVDASWDSIIQENVFDKVQEKLKWNKKVKTSPTHDFILSGLLVCDECGKPLFGQSANGRSGKHFYYGHKEKSECRVKRYPALQLESIVKKQLFSFLNSKALNEQFIEAVTDLSKSRPKSNKNLLELKNKEIENLKIDIERLMDLITNNQIAKGLDTILERVKTNEDQIKTLEVERDSLEQKALSSRFIFIQIMLFD